MIELVSFFDGVLYNITGLLFVALGVLTLIRLTGFPDLTVDGSFTVGAAVFVLLLVNEYGAGISLVASIASGVAAGCSTWFINQQLGVGKVVSGVLSMLLFLLFAPYVATSTMSVYRTQSVFTAIDSIDRKITDAMVADAAYQWHPIFTAVVAIAFALVVGAHASFFSTRSGLLLRYSGSAALPYMVNASRRSLNALIGLVAGNGLVALGGAVEAQRRGGYSANMGIGMILIAMTVLILGEALVKTVAKRDHLHLHEYYFALLSGCFFYSCGVQGLLRADLVFVDLKLLTSLFLLLLLAVAGRFYSSSTRLF